MKLNVRGFCITADLPEPEVGFSTPHPITRQFRLFVEAIGHKKVYEFSVILGLIFLKWLCLNAEAGSLLGYLNQFIPYFFSRT